VWGIIQGYGNYWLLVTAVQLGVFDALQRLEPCRLEVMCTELGIPERTGLFLMDGLVSIGMIEQYRDEYELGDLATRYLTSDGAASMANLIAVAPGPLENWIDLADTFRRGTPSNPIENDPSSFYLPLVEATFPTIHRAASRADLKIGYSRHRGLRLLDLGAGCGPWTAAVLQKDPTATSTVNDLPGVISAAERTLGRLGVANRVTYLPGDFHEVEIEPCAYDLVVLGHVIRTEGDVGAQHLIGRAFEALKPGGRVVVADYFRDNTRKFNPFGVLMGLTMIAATRRGSTFTNEEVSEWILAAGFRGIRLIEPIGFNQMYVAEKPH
jgi:SAM-dependent methyltransferase